MECTKKATWNNLLYRNQRKSFCPSEKAPKKFQKVKKQPQFWEYNLLFLAMIVSAELWLMPGMALSRGTGRSDVAEVACSGVLLFLFGIL